MKMPLTSKSDEENQSDADTGLNGDFEMPLANQNLYGLISCKEYKNQLFELSKTFDSLSNKNTFNNSGTKYFQSHHFENVDSFPFDDCKKTYSEELKQKNNEYLNEKEDLKDTNGKMAKIAEDNFSHLEKGGGEEGGEEGNREEIYESCDDSYEMTYIELDLSSQDNQQVSDDDIFIEMMKNLKIKPNKISLDSNFSDFYSDTTKSFKDYSNEQNKGNESSQQDLVSNTMKENFNLDDTTTTITSCPLYPITTAHKLVHSSFNNNNSQKECSLNELGPKSSNFYLKKEKRPEFFGSFLSVIESNLCSLPERAYAQIAAHLLDEETILDAEDCDPDSLNKNNISIVMSEMELSISDEADSAYQTMTYIDLDINESCSEDITLELFNKLNIKDDDTPLCRGNSSDQNEVQNDSLGSNIVETDFKVLSNTHLISANMIDINSFTNISIDPSSMETLLSDNGFNSGFADSVSNNSLAKKNVKNSSEIETIDLSPSSSEIGLTQTCVLPSQTSLTSHCTNAPDLSFFDVNFQNEDNSYESEFVTENLHELEEIKEILGLTEPSIPNTISPPPTKKMMMMTSTPPPAVAPSPSPPCNISSLPWQQMLVVNKISTEKSFQSNKVVPRITTQTCVTQSEAMAAFPGFFLVMSPSSMHSLKRTAFSEVLEPIKKPYRCDNSLQSAGSRNKLKKHVSSLKDENLLEFKDNESCLHKAVRTMNTEYVSALLKRLHKLESSNLDIINYKNENLQTALHLAVQENTPAIVHLLIQNGAEVNLLALTSSNRLEAPLHYVASRGNQFRLIFQHLLKTNDLNLNIKNSTGQTALHCAVLAHNTMDSKSFSTIDSNYIITKLLTKNADPCIQDSNGKNVLMLALESKDEKLVRQILKTVNKDHIHQLLTATSKNGQTCFDLAFSLKEQFHESSYEKVIHLLTQYKNT